MPAGPSSILSGVATSQAMHMTPSAAALRPLTALAKADPRYDLQLELLRLSPLTSAPLLPEA